MVSQPNCVEISSDDEEEDRNQGWNGTTGTTGLLYLSKVFNTDLEDDDVVIIDNSTSTDKMKRTRLIRSAMDDDECCMLDSDPCAIETTDIVSPQDSDEVVMIGQKGHVACRDFPHARHSCVQFPFNATPHVNFCTQCHCYVCDSLAPCPLWGDGNNPNDHCHATEEFRWRTLRKLTRCGTVLAPATPTSTVANPMGGSRLVQTTLFQAHCVNTSPIRPSPMGNPVSSGVSRQVQDTAATVKRDPLVIKLPKGRGRGRSSQHSHHLGVRTNSPRAHRILPPSSFPGNKASITSRASSVHHRRTGDEVTQSIPAPPAPPLLYTSYSDSGPGRAGGTVAAIPLSPPQYMPTHNLVPGRAGDEVTQSLPAQSAPPLLYTPYSDSGPGRAGGAVAAMPPSPPQYIPTHNLVPGRAGGAVAAMPPSPPQYIPTHNLVPGRAGGVGVMPPPTPTRTPKPVHVSRHVAPYYTAVPPPLPNSPPPYIPPPPTVVYDHPPGYPPPPPFDRPPVYPPPGAYDQHLVRPPGADVAVGAGFVSPVSHIPDSRYVSASALSVQEACNVNMAPFYQDQSTLQPYTDYVGQDYRSPGGLESDPLRYASCSDNVASNGASNVDMLAGPMEGWVVDAASQYDPFDVAGFDAVTSSNQKQQGPSSLNDVLEQMAGDDYLWDHFPRWFTHH